MKKSILFKTMAMIVAMVASVSLASCGDDEEPVDPADPAELKGMAVTYSLESSEDLLSFFDITVVNGVDDNSGASENIASGYWDKVINYGEKSEAMPGKLFFKAIAKPKASIPAIDQTRMYRFKAAYKVSVSGIRNDGQYMILSNDNGSNPNLNLKGDKVQNFLDKGEIVIANYSFDVPVK